MDEGICSRSCKKRTSNHGSIYFDFSDVWIDFTSFYPNGDILGLFEELPELLQKVDTSLCKDWSIVFSDGAYSISPNFNSVREQLSTNTARDVEQEEVEAAITAWKLRNLPE